MYPMKEKCSITLYFVGLCISISFFMGCQKEVVLASPGAIIGQDSTDVGTDSTIYETADSLTFISFSPDSGHIGTEVHIMGSGFDLNTNGNQVRLNNTMASIVSATKTVLTIQIPQASTSG